MNPLPLFLIIVSLPLLLGGCGEKVEVEPEAEVKPVEEVPLNPNLKYEIKDDEVTITGCDKKASGELTIPASIEGKPVTSIGIQAFNGCTSLTSITIPDSVISIGDKAFSVCYNLTSIMIPDSVTSIGSYAFARCSSLTSITIPDSVTSIESHAFDYCEKLTSITIPDSITSIESHAFSYCTSLTSITIAEGVTSIESHAFDYCEKLTSITIPDSVTSIQLWAFFNRKNLTAVIFLGDAPKDGWNRFSPFSTIYRKPEAKGWGDTWGGRPVKLISEKP